MLAVLIFAYLASNARVLYETLRTLFNVVVGIFIVWSVVAGVIMAVREDLPKTREIPVYFTPQNWALGEIKDCYSEPEQGELVSLVCEWVAGLTYFEWR
jgi:hypothetical protein